FIVSALVSSYGYNEAIAAKCKQKAAEVILGQTKNTFTIIIDAGHGGEDPGAVANGISEKNINLAISKKLKDFFSMTDINVVLTRIDDKLLYKSGEESKKKFYDLRNRLNISNEYPDSIFVSIHCNKFPIEKYNGLQVFYSLSNEKSLLLADSVQKLSKLVMPLNNREIKMGNNIFILEQILTPAIFVECGFISNLEESIRLSTDEYQNKLSFSIYCGIVNYFGDKNEN
ncbi:MAG: N-acetylmuramoyl-L-alanine amidase, partial [Clostridia bacterium]